MAGASTSVDLVITAGLPYNRRFRVVGGTAIWASTDQFEVRSQVRELKSPNSPLLFALTPFLQSQIEGEDIVVDLSMTGAQTRPLVKGFYDIVISDTDTTDAKALILSSGKVKVGTTVTAASDA